MAHNVFISYSWKDEEIAGAVCAKLESREIRCWIASRDILPGAAFMEATVNAILSSEIFVLVLSANSNSSLQVLREIERAVSKGIPILPFVIENVKLSRNMEYFIRTLYWLDAMTPPFDNHLNTLADNVVSLLMPMDKVSPLTKERPSPVSPHEERPIRHILSIFRNIRHYMAQNRDLPIASELTNPLSQPNERLESHANSEENFKQDVSRVQFSAVAPKKFKKGEYTNIEIIMYEEHYRKEVDIALRKLGANGKETRKGIFEAVNRSKVRIVLDSSDVNIEGNVEENIWYGEFCIFGFQVFLPNDYCGKQILFNGKVYIDMILITSIKFTANVTSFVKQKISMDEQKALSAFISYASQDRDKVAARIQGMKLMMPNADIFFDVESLRRGQEWEPILWAEIDKRDILYLFWSRNAKQSEWVNKEWKYVLRNKGLHAIEPVPLEPPEICPPPEELAKKHFNDWTLRYTSYVPN